MGQLSGFRYRDIVQRLKLFGFSFKLREVTKSGTINQQAITQRFQITQATAPRHSQGHLETGRDFRRRFHQYETFIIKEGSTPHYLRLIIKMVSL